MTPSGQKYEFPENNGGSTLSVRRPLMAKMLFRGTPCRHVPNGFEFGSRYFLGNKLWISIDHFYIGNSSFRHYVAPIGTCIAERLQRAVTVFSHTSDRPTRRVQLVIPFD